MQSGKIRVFLVDDHELIRRGLRACVEAEPDLVVVGEAANAREARARIPASRPDVTVLDVSLPDGNGIDVCREIRSMHPEIRFLILTAMIDDRILFDAIMAGAAGYSLKNARGDGLPEGIRRIAEGHSLLDPAATSKVLSRLRQERLGTTPLRDLTEQERRILDLIGQGLTNRQIAQQVHLAEKTVKNYVSRLLTKLGMEHRVQAALYVARAGSPAHQGHQEDRGHA